MEYKYNLPHVNIVVVLRVSQVYHLFPDLVDGLSVALHVCEVIVGWVLQIVVNHPKAGVEDQETVCVQGKGISKWAQLGPRGKPAKEIKALIQLKGGGQFMDLSMFEIWRVFKKKTGKVWFRFS